MAAHHTPLVTKTVTIVNNILGKQELYDEEIALWIIPPLTVLDIKYLLMLLANTCIIKELSAKSKFLDKRLGVFYT